MFLPFRILSFSYLFSSLKLSWKVGLSYPYFFSTFPSFPTPFPLPTRWVDSLFFTLPWILVIHLFDTLPEIKLEWVPSFSFPDTVNLSVFFFGSFSKLTSLFDLLSFSLLFSSYFWLFYYCSFSSWFDIILVNMFFILHRFHFVFPILHQVHQQITPNISRFHFSRKEYSKLKKEVKRGLLDILKKSFVTIYFLSFIHRSTLTFQTYPRRKILNDSLILFKWFILRT